MNRAPRTAHVVPLRTGPRHTPPLAQAIDARRHLATASDRRRRAESPGRAWINGREVGGAEQRYRHLLRSYD